jgi:hypothetical protein
MKGAKEVMDRTTEYLTGARLMWVHPDERDALYETVRWFRKWMTEFDENTDTMDALWRTEAALRDAQDKIKELHEELAQYPVIHNLVTRELYDQVLAYGDNMRTKLTAVRTALAG